MAADNQDQDLRDLERKVTKHISKKRCHCTVWPMPKDEAKEPEETIRIRVEMDEDPGVTIEAIARREWLQDVRPRASLIETLGARVNEARKRLKGEAA